MLPVYSGLALFQPKNLSNRANHFLSHSTKPYLSIDCPQKLFLATRWLRIRYRPQLRSSRSLRSGFLCPAARAGPFAQCASRIEAPACVTSALTYIWMYDADFVCSRSLRLKVVRVCLHRYKVATFNLHQRAESSILTAFFNARQHKEGTWFEYRQCPASKIHACSAEGLHIMWLALLRSSKTQHRQSFSAAWSLPFILLTRCLTTTDSAPRSLVLDQDRVSFVPYIDIVTTATASLSDRPVKLRKGLGSMFRTRPSRSPWTDV